MGVISFVVFLYSVDVSSKRDIFVRYYFFAVGMYGSGVSWIFVSINDFGGVPSLAAIGLTAAFILSYSFTSLMGALLHVNVRDGLVAFPAIWVILEWSRSWFLTGFPWLFAGYSHLESPLSGYIPIVGVYGLSLLTVVTSVLIYKLPSSKWPLNILLLGLLWGGGIFIPDSIIGLNHTNNVVTVSAIQGNVDQHKKWLSSSTQNITNTYLEMTEKEWGRDIIVWPEAALTVIKQDASPLIKGLDEQGREVGSSLLFGILERSTDGGYFNSVLALGEGSGVYHKRRLVPFGEYLPLEKYLRGIIKFFDLPMSRTKSGHNDQNLVSAGENLVSVLICYEVVYPDLIERDSVLPDMFVTVSNDTWFGDSIGPKQHLQMARMRAAEYGRWMIRSTNNGITALIDHNGLLVEELEPFEEGVMRGELRIMKGETPYYYYGYGPLVLLCLIFIFVLFVRHRFL